MSSTSPRQEQTRYFCYACNAEVPIYMAPDPTCQRCNEQFVQEIDAESDPQSFLSGGDDAATATATAEGADHEPHYFRYDTRTGNEDDLLQFLDSFAPRDDDGGNGNNRPSLPAMSAMLQNMVTMLLTQTGEAAGGTGGGAGATAASGPTAGEGTTGQGATTTEGSQDEQGGENQQQQQQRRSDDGPPQPMLFYGGMVDGNFQFRPMAMPTQRPRGEEGEDGAAATEEGGQGTGAAGAGRDNRMNGLTSLLHLLYGLSDGMVGNPNDYVFSQDGFDNIITQLMEQASGRNAPPPAPENIIDSLPKRKLTDEEIAQQTDCAVCKEEFVLTEEAIELPCQHLFHDDCIKPWLKVNGTCPVCRHSVEPEKKDQPENSQASTSDSTRQNGENTRPPPPNASTSGDQQSNNSSQNNARSSLQNTVIENVRRMYFPTGAGWAVRPGTDTRQNNNSNSTQSPSDNNHENNNSPNTPHQPSPDSNSNNENSHMDLDLD